MKKRKTGKNIEIPTKVRTIQTIYEKEIKTDIGPLIKEGRLTETEWNTEEEKIQKTFFGHWDLK